MEMVAKKMMSIRLDQTLYEEIEKTTEKTGKSRTDIIEEHLVEHKEFRSALLYFFKLFNLNARNLDLTDDDHYQIRKIKEMLQKNV